MPCALYNEALSQDHDKIVYLLPIPLRPITQLSYTFSFFGFKNK